ncbi:hypothetical protein V1514DRAFT_7651 [Lipomyces japonicus]|uniref:uncharacterized protein n=1 Tax=Lipomyces japonicus TaxID=56871 RepID=UPI0034CFFC25
MSHKRSKLEIIRLRHQTTTRSTLFRGTALHIDHRNIHLMTNTDSKILTQAINTRLTHVIADLIHPSQTGFIPNRWIGDNIETIQAVTESEITNGFLAKTSSLFIFFILKKGLQTPSYIFYLKYKTLALKKSRTTGICKY